MRGIKGFLWPAAVCLAFFAGCAPARVAESGRDAHAVPPPPEGYSAGMAASYYFLQGVKVSNLYGDTDEALRLFEKALAQDSSHSAAYYETANIFLQSDPGKALAYSRKANALDSTNIWYKLQLGQIHIMTESYDSALTIYRDILNMSPNNPEYYSYLAALYEQTGRTDSAIALLDSAEMRLGLVEGLAAYKRQLLIGSGQRERAIEESKILAASFPYDESNFVILGELYMADGEDSLALEAFQLALSIDRHSIEALASLADYYRKKNDEENFMQTTLLLFDSEKITAAAKIDFFDNVFRNAHFYREHYLRVTDLVAALLHRHPDDFNVQKFYAMHLINSGNAPKALEVYKAGLKDSVRQEAISEIIAIESFLGNSDSADHYINEGLKFFPGDPEMYMRKAYSLHAKERYREAEKEMNKALEHAPSDSLKSVITASIGDMRYSRDSLDMKKVYPLYEKAIALDPDNAMALNNYSYYLSLEGRDLDKALKMIEHVMELEPGNATYIDTYGWVLFKMGRYEEARSVLRRAISLDPENNKELFLHLGDVLFELKEYMMASIYWKRALESGYDAGEIETRLKKIEEAEGR